MGSTNAIVAGSIPGPVVAHRHDGPWEVSSTASAQAAIATGPGSPQHRPHYWKQRLSLIVVLTSSRGDHQLATASQFV